MTMTANGSTDMPLPNDAAKRRYNLFLLVVAGLGGLLYGIDVGIIGGALPYLEATFRVMDHGLRRPLSPSELSTIVAAVLLGSVISTLFAGLLADWIGRKPLMVLAGVTFIFSIPIIALSHGFEPLFLGRLLQGISGGFIGVVVPLYLAECLSASRRGRGTGVFQWLLTLGIVAAAVVGMYYSYRVAAVAATADAATLLAYKDQVWRRIFWVSFPPGVLFVLGSLLVGESPRWLFQRGKSAAAFAVLLRSRSEEQAAVEVREMEETSRSAEATRSVGKKAHDSLLRRKYVIPFLLACVILFCNTATGINSIIGFNTGILLQSGLSDLQAHWGYVIFTTVNFAMTMVGMMLVDRKGRKFLLVLGTSGIIVSLLGVGILFVKTEKLSLDSRSAVQTLVNSNQELTLRFDQAEASRLLSAQGNAVDTIDARRASLAIIYSYGDFTAATSFVRSDDPIAAQIQISRAGCVPANKVEALFKNPFGNLVATSNSTKDIKKNRLHAWIGQDNSHRSRHLICARAATNIQKIGRITAKELQNVHRGHCQPGSVHHTANITVQLDKS